jgi:hypothetical protein
LNDRDDRANSFWLWRIRLKLPWMPRIQHLLWVLAAQIFGALQLWHAGRFLLSL